MESVSKAGICEVSRQGTFGCKDVDGRVHLPGRPHAIAIQCELPTINDGWVHPWSLQEEGYGQTPDLLAVKRSSNGPRWGEKGAARMPTPGTSALETRQQTILGLCSAALGWPRQQQPQQLWGQRWALRLHSLQRWQCLMRLTLIPVRLRRTPCRSMTPVHDSEDTEVAAVVQAPPGDQDVGPPSDQECWTSWCYQIVASNLHQQERKKMGSVREHWNDSREPGNSRESANRFALNWAI